MTVASDKRNHSLQSGPKGDGGRLTARRSGGRTARTRDAVFAATIDELGDRGYARTSVESIALRAGVHKTTVYRRWGSKDTLLAEALTQAAIRAEVVDTGDIDTDMRTFAGAVLGTLTSRAGVATVRAIVAEAPSSPELRDVLARFWTSRDALVGPIIHAAIERGQLPAGTSPTELMRYVAAPLHYQLLMTDDPLTAADADRASAAAVAAARAGTLSHGMPDSDPSVG